MNTQNTWLTPRRLMAVSVGVAALTILLKALAWWLTGSTALLSDALESLVNLAGALFGLVMLNLAAQPADAQHPYGHHKAEYFASGFEGLLIFCAALLIMAAALPRLWAPQPLAQLGWGMVLSVLSAIANGALAWLMLRGARRAQSIALEAGARHLFADVWTSAGVLAGLLLVLATGWLWLDAAVAMAVALNILCAGARLAWRSAQGLMDAAVEPQIQAQIEQIVRGFVRTGDAGEPLVRFDHVTTRKAGQRHFVDFHMHMPANWTLAQATALREEVERALTARVPGLRATVQMLPLNAEAHAGDTPAPPRPEDGAAP